jgi:protein TonB
MAVTYDVSLAPPRLQPMPPAALALAILLHAAVAAVIWWLSPLQPPRSQDEPIMVMFDATPTNVGLQTPEKPGPPPESTAASPQPPAEAPREAQQQALAPPSSDAQPRPEPVPSLPLFEFSVPPPPEPPPAPTSRDFPRQVAPRPPPRPVQRTQPLPPRPAPTQQRPPADAPAAMPSPIPGPEPGDVLIGQGRQRNDYLSRLFRHLEPYRVSARTARGSQAQGRVVTRVTIRRDGGLIDVRIDTSSGRPAVDAMELEAIRNGAPFPPVPAGMPGDPVVLILRMTY